jgi:hypothetical protein
MIRDATWVVIDTHDPWVPRLPGQINRAMWGTYAPDLVATLVDRLLGSSSWHLAYKRDGVLVFRKSA